MILIIAQWWYRYTSIHGNIFINVDKQREHHYFCDQSLEFCVFTMVDCTQGRIRHQWKMEAWFMCGNYKPISSHTFRAIIPILITSKGLLECSSCTKPTPSYTTNIGTRLVDNRHHVSICNLWQMSSVLKEQLLQFLPLWNGMWSEIFAPNILII